MFLLDTNVVSQLTKRQPNAGVMAFMEEAKVAESPLYLSVLTIGEIEKGISKLARFNDVQQVNKLTRWKEQLVRDFTDYILPVDDETSVIWGRILALTDDTNAIDKLIAATALQYDLTLITHNIDRIANTGAKYANPFAYDTETNSG